MHYVVRLLLALPIIHSGVDCELSHTLVTVYHKKCHFNLQEWSGSAKAIGGQSEDDYYYYSFK